MRLNLVNLLILSNLNLSRTPRHFQIHSIGVSASPLLDRRPGHRDVGLSRFSPRKLYRVVCRCDFCYGSPAVSGPESRAGTSVKLLSPFSHLDCADRFDSTLRTQATPGGTGRYQTGKERCAHCAEQAFGEKGSSAFRWHRAGGAGGLDLRRRLHGHRW